jgi:hypothetical protein
MVSDGDRPHPQPQKIFGRTALVIPIVIGFILSGRNAAAET